MVDVVVASAFVAAGVLAVNRRLTPHEPRVSMGISGPGSESDLPCPWCQAATREDDERCPSCRQGFG
jgi:hypothetical protein